MEAAFDDEVEHRFENRFLLVRLCGHGYMILLYRAPARQ
jgi:hypothetical protein